MIAEINDARSQIYTATRHNERFEMPTPTGPFTSIRGLNASRLHEFHQMEHRELGVAAALDYCAEHDVPVPEWVAKGAAALLCDLLKREVSQKRGRSSGFVARYRQDMVDFIRWDTVKEVRDKQPELLEEVKELQARNGIPKHFLKEREKYLGWVGNTLDRAFECAAMILRDAGAAASINAVRKSYRLVIRGSGKRRTLRYYQLDPRFLRKVGITLKGISRQGKKVVPLYDLTL
jgi:hypothetical protein